MRAIHILSSAGNKDVVLFLPLAPIIFNYSKKSSSREVLSPLEHLNSAIIEYLRLEGLQISNSKLDEHLKDSKTLLLFDGIDEVVSFAPWIIDAIEYVAKHYPNSQVICSARTGGNYLSGIPFLGIYLLPFTDQQRAMFISNWFENSDDERVKKIVIHLKDHPILAEIVRSPLLATILCVLAEHGIELPEGRSVFIKNVCIFYLAITIYINKQRGYPQLSICLAQSQEKLHSTFIKIK